MSVLLREAIGGSIRRARTERNRTLRDVSHSARVSLGYLSEIERGRKEPSSELLAAICEALKLPLPDLLDEVADALRPDDEAAARPVRRPRPVAVLDPALRTAVEEALEEALEPVTDADADELTDAPAGVGEGPDDEEPVESPSACLLDEPAVVAPDADAPPEDDEPTAPAGATEPPVVLVGLVPLPPPAYAAA